jgi:hypothetical protein
MGTGNLGIAMRTLPPFGTFRSVSLLPELKRRDGCSGMECRQGGLAGIDLVDRDHDLTRTPRLILNRQQLHRHVQCNDNWWV